MAKTTCTTGQASKHEATRHLEPNLFRHDSLLSRFICADHGKNEKIGMARLRASSNLCGPVMGRLLVCLTSETATFIEGPTENEFTPQSGKTGFRWRSTCKTNWRKTFENS